MGYFLFFILFCFLLIKVFVEIFNEIQSLKDRCNVLENVLVGLVEILKGLEDIDK